MKRHGAPTEQGGWVAYLVLILGAGLALLLSMPWVSTIEELTIFPWRPTPIVFLGAYAFFGAALGINRGAAQAPRGLVRWRHLGPLIGQILLGHLLVLPYLVFLRILMPGRVDRLPLIVGYAVLVGVVWGVGAYARQSARWRQGSLSSGGAYVLLACLFGVPLIGRWLGGVLELVALASPIGAMSRMLAEEPGAGVGIAFGLQTVALVAVLIWFIARKRSSWR